MVSNQLIIGCMRWGKWGKALPSDQFATLLEETYALGYRKYDHADIYGAYTTEAQFGRALEESSIDRANIYLITKCGICYPAEGVNGYKVKHYNTTSSYVRSQVEASLVNLKTDYIDMLLIHRPDPLMNYEELGRMFEALQSEGKVRDFGVSNFEAHQLSALNKFFPISANQVEASLAHLAPFVDGTFDTCQQLGIMPQVWSPLGGGKLFSPETEQERRIHEALDICSSKYDQSIGNILLRFLLEHPTQPQLVLGSTNIDRLRESMEVFDFNLEREDWFALWTASQGRRVA